MPQLNPLTREVLLKIVYYGPGLGGKTTSLSHVHTSAPAETRGELVSLATPVDRTLYFDFLPVRLPSVRGHGVRLQLFTVPGQVYFNATRKLVLTGADGLVFVADSQAARRDANVESLENLIENLNDQGRRLESVPHVLQYNKRDLTDVISLADLDHALNAHGAPSFATSAVRGEGVVEALDAVVRRVLEDLDSRRVFGESGALPEVTLGRADDALDEQVSRATEGMTRSAASSVLPPQARRGATAPSFAPLFADDEPHARAVERSLVDARLADAIAGCERLVRRVLGDAAVGAGLEGRDDDLVVVLLGIEGARWLSFRRLVRRARDGGPVSERDGLEAYHLAVDLRLRANRL
jgi:signal recognition particle receptor subunit beta